MARSPWAWIAALLQVLAAAVFLPAVSSAAPLNDAAFEALLAHNPATGRPVDSVTELVPLLPRELRTNFTFVYASRSPFKDEISPQAPRVILFSKDARFIVTFTGDPSLPGGDLVETMSFDDASQTFHVHAYLLPSAQRKAWRPSAQASNCASCHGDDTRPIFDSYPLWPGFYGSVIDTFFDDDMGRNEQKNYRAFLAGPAKTGVYQGLIFSHDGPVPPYLDPARSSASSIDVGPTTLSELPNTRLGMALTELNRKRIYRKLASAPGFAGHEKEFLAELLDCPGARQPSAQTVQAVTAALEAENTNRLARLGGKPSGERQSVDGLQSLEGMEEMKRIHELAELDDVATRAGADRSDWSMALEARSLSFYDGILTGMHGGKSYYLKEDLIFEILDHLGSSDPALRRYFSSRRVYALFGYPFGDRPNLGLALQSCPLLTAPASAQVATAGH